LNLFHPSSWQDYELLDSGGFEKLERFGKVILIRPEPQAIWERVLTESDWKKQAHAHFTREQKDNFRFGDEVKGGWVKLKPMQDSWQVNYQYQSLNLTLRLAPTGFGHVGLFPEQGSNWNLFLIQSQVGRSKTQEYLICLHTQVLQAWWLVLREQM
jgi:23S rRNA (cytosine1962-C5)-methyltransferase